MHRIYCPQNDFQQEVLITNKNELHHLRNVLRFKKNDAVQLFNGKDREALGIIHEISPTNTTVKITEVRSFVPSAPVIVLACALPKRGKFETIIEKTTELGVDEIIPLATHRSEVRLKEGDRLLAKMRRFETVAINAAKQCKRTRLPYLHPLTDFRGTVDQLSADSKILVASLATDRQPLAKILPTIAKESRLSLLIGPEGDLTKEEQEYALMKGATPISLGKNVLKVETAAIAAVSFIRLYFSS